MRSRPQTGPEPIEWDAVEEVERDYEEWRRDRPKPQEQPAEEEVDEDQIERDFKEWQEARAAREKQKEEAAATVEGLP